MAPEAKIVVTSGRLGEHEGREVQRIRNCPTAPLPDTHEAGVVQWWNVGFPSLKRGFDSLHPFHSAQRLLPLCRKSEENSALLKIILRPATQSGALEACDSF